MSPKISQGFSYTFQPGNGQWSKISLDVHEIDTELPLDEQLQGVEDAVEAVWSFLRNKLDRQIEEVYTEAKGAKK